MEEDKIVPKENIKTIHTYSSDMADAIRINEMSVIKIALAEQKRQEQEEFYKKSETTKKSKVLLFLGGTFIIFLGIGLTYYLLQKNNIENVPTQITKNSETLISYDNQVFIDVNNVTSISDLSIAINTESKKIEKIGTIKSLFLTKLKNNRVEIISLENLLSLIKTTAPFSLIRSLDTPYVIGTYQSNDINQKPHLFLLLQTKDYSQSYKGMLDWEKTLFDDLFVLFNIDVSGTNNSLFETQWKDIIINNKDGRVLYDRNGNAVLYYLFINKSNFIITDDQETIKEVSLRLLIKNVKPL